MRAFLILAAVVIGGVLGARPAGAAPPLDTYGRLPALEMVRLSPSGEYIAFIAVDGENRKLFVRKVGGDAILVSPAGTAKIRDLEWAGDDYVLVSAYKSVELGEDVLNKFNQYTKGNLAAILVVDLKKRAVSRMFEHKLSAFYLGQALSIGAREISGRWVDFVYAYMMNHGLDIYKVDLDTDNYSVVSGSEGGKYGIRLDSQGTIAVRYRYDEPTRTWSLLAGAQGQQVITQRRSDLNLIHVHAGRTENTMLVDEEGPAAYTADEYPLSPGAHATRLFDGLEVDDYLFDPVSHLLIGAALTGDAGAVFFDPALQRRYDAARKAFQAYQMTIVSMSSGLSKMVVKTDGGDDPGTFWLVDLTTGKAEDLMQAYPDVAQKDVGPTSLFKNAAGDGLPLDGVLTLPPGSTGKDLPLVVMPHGGPIGVRDKVGFDFWAQAFSSRGYAVFQPNYRGSSGHGPAFLRAGYGQWGHKMLTDIGDGVGALAKAGIIDPKRACIVGDSYGGYAALAGVTIQRGIYRCAVSVSGISEVSAIIASRGDSSDYSSGRYSHTLFGVSFGGDPSLEGISPLSRAGEASAPILLIHGKNDTTVPFVQSLAMDSALTRTGKSVEFLPLDGEDHYMSLQKTRIQIIEASVAFVQKYNPAS
jgi:dipeptidyl aminopeptidase/acylaminoacyl peptidase